MKKILVLLFVLILNNHAFGAGSDSSSDSSSSTSGTALYDQAVKLVKRAGKLEKKDKGEKAKKLYSQAFKKLNKAYKTDKKNPDILNYLGFTLRKVGKYDQAEKYYLQGLEIKPDHNGINEYLGELYVQTQRMDLAKERLAVLKDCNCEEYKELKEVINNN